MNKLISAAAFDPEIAAAGVEVTYSPNGKDTFRTTIRQGGASNNAYAKELEEQFRPFRQSGLDPNELDLDVQRKIIATALAKTVIIGWNADDFGAPYSVDLAIKTMMEVPGYAAFITNQSGKENLFRKKSIEDASGN